MPQLFLQQWRPEEMRMRSLLLLPDTPRRDRDCAGTDREPEIDVTHDNAFELYTRTPLESRKAEDESESNLWSGSPGIWPKRSHLLTMKSLPSPASSGICVPSRLGFSSITGTSSPVALSISAIFSTGTSNSNAGQSVYW